MDNNIDEMKYEHYGYGQPNKYFAFRSSFPHENEVSKNAAPIPDITRYIDNLE
jgi:hypothetical protein